MYSKIPGIHILKLTWAYDGMDDTKLFEEHWSHSCLWVPWIRLMKQIAGNAWKAAWMFKGPRTTWENIIFSKKSVATSQSDIDGEDSILGFFEERCGESGWSREI